MDKWTLDLQPGTPIYLQIVEQIKRQIVAGELRPGTRLPAVRELAASIGLNPSTVAKAYAELEHERVIETRRGGGSFVSLRRDDPLLAAMREERLTNLLGRVVVEALSLGFEPDEVEASFALHLSRWRDSRVNRHRSARKSDADERTLRFSGSHDLAIELLLGQFNRVSSETAVSPLYVGSLGGLFALQGNAADIAGCHLLDEESGDYNRAYIARLLPAQEVVLVTVVERLQGLMVSKGNPKNILGLTDLARPGIRFVNRQRGSGTRVLLDFKLRASGVNAGSIVGYDQEEETHLGVATTVADGRADVGLGILAAARALGLDFLPVQKERYDLAMLRSTFELTVVQSMLGILRGADYRGVVSAMGGYDVTLSGTLVA